MSKWILPFEDIGRTDVSVAGGKGANIGALVGKGFPVPPGFVVSAEACQSFFRDINLPQEAAQFSNTHPVRRHIYGKPGYGIPGRSRYGIELGYGGRHRRWAGYTLDSRLLSVSLLA